MGATRATAATPTAAIHSAVMAAVLATFLAWSAPAKANTIDLSTWTCKQFQSASKNEITLILAWLDGYYRAEDDPLVVDTDQLDGVRYARCFTDFVLSE